MKKLLLTILKILKLSKVNYLILVNKHNLLLKDFVPKKMVKVSINSVNHLDKKYKCYVNKKVLKKFNSLRKKAFLLGYVIDIDSAYRSYSYQKEIFLSNYQKNGLTALKRVARPGASEHQTALAIDFCVYRNNKYIEVLDDDLEEVRWVIDNCYKYGFILRYPKDKTQITEYDYEPWHIRYVGKRVAKKIYKKKICLEEYFLTIKR